ncbi:hypothetical protein [Cecembia lonarensis]|uniref:Uncharacterized protein n=1 Tax=Cecembia lonarensis (strain CCUG 58316 / KCTC 22772 / LW9) TaxID=1225176 RepID=K1L993_CECL9|nr:hypothetical protein [Cecembia lonarensis]EKB48727.1 hypothetical protein B879_02686 [Cecembia lonarensis LW9]
MKRLRLIEFGGIPGSGKSFMVNKLALRLKEKLGYYPAPIFEWDQLLKNIPVWEDLKIQENEFNKLLLRIYKRWNIDSFGINKSIIHAAEEGAQKAYIDLYLDIQDFKKNSEHAIKFPRDAEIICKYLKILTEYYYYYINHHTKWSCLLLSEGYGKHSTHIISHQRRLNPKMTSFLQNAPNIDLYFYLDTDLKTAYERKRNMKGFYAEYDFIEAEKLLEKTKQLNEAHLEILKESGVEVFRVNNNEFEPAFEFIFNQIISTISN